MKAKFPFYKQSESKDCGPTCLKIISKYYKKEISIEKIRQWSETTRIGSSIRGLCNAAEKIGFRAIAIKTDFDSLESEDVLPCIAHWKGGHFVVIYKIDKKYVYVSDPAMGLIKYDKSEFIQFWTNNKNSNKETEGILLLLYTTAVFFEKDLGDIQETKNEKRFSYFFAYALKYKKFLIQLFLGLLAGTIIQAIIPFLTQSVVDIGIQNQDIDFLYLIFFSQFMIYVGTMTLGIIRGWIFLHLNTRINISLISDFFIKLMKLPISYFDSRMTGDILQRIADHKRIEQLLTTDSLNILFSFINMIVFAVILGIYDTKILAIFGIGSVLYLLWILIFLKRRKEIDYKSFNVASKDKSKVIELINGMQEIKLHNAERKKRWGWELIQTQRFKVNMEGLMLRQVQDVGSSFINQCKNLSMSFLTAMLVIDGDLTLGMMLSVSYIIGQLSTPVEQMIRFINKMQDAKISIDRINEVYKLEDENASAVQNGNLHLDKGITIEQMTFRYPGAIHPTLSDINLYIPPNKTTAIVGSSGSGKTTLMKLILGFYKPENGKIEIGTQDLAYVSKRKWREVCGVVMQEGYIFNDTIVNNIAVDEGLPDYEKVENSIRLSNLDAYIKMLPQRLETVVGMEGLSMSTGQKQRMLIARAIYKDPSFVFFDEATSALDAENEKIITNSLSTFLQNKTAVVIAHRLSTVKNADQIIVVDQGKIAEIGDHESLIAKKAIYYSLVKNQLELGK